MAGYTPAPSYLTDKGVSNLGKRWTEEEDLLLISKANGKTYDDLCLFFPNRSKDAISVRCSKLNINHLIVNKSLSWTEEDNLLLIEKYPNLTFDELKVFFNNKTDGAIKTQAQRLGLKKNKAIFNSIKKNNSHKSILYWTSEKSNILKNYINNFGVTKNIYALFPEHAKEFVDKKVKLVLGKQTNLSILRTYISDKDIKQLKLFDILLIYKKILNSRLSGFSHVELNKYDIIMCFKYFLKTNNIKFNRSDWLNICFGNFLEQSFLKVYVKKYFDGYYDFICYCYPQYHFKLWEFSKLDVPNKFWENKYNRFSCYKHGINNLLKDGYIDKIENVLTINNSIARKYFNATLVSIYHFDGLIEYLEYIKVNYNDSSRKFIFNKILFDSKEEKNLYVYILNKGFRIYKCSKSNKFYNKIHNEYYIPDFFIEFDNIKIIIEYFGMYKNNDSLNKIYENYKTKTHRKVEFYQHLNDYLFIDLYPNDLKNNFEGVRNKLTSFFMEKFNIDIL